MKYLKLNAERSGYAVSQVRRTMTVADLKSLLEDFDDELPVYLSHDNGYTYGGLTESSFEETESEDKE